jgi:putative oxidoreductase
MNNTVVPLASRILLSLLFFVSGYTKLMNVAGTAGYFTKIGLPMADVLVWLVIGVELLGALLIVLGWQTRIVAWIMAIFTLGTALLGHKFWVDPSQATQFLKNLGLIGGFLLLAAYGPGRASIDRR